MSDGAFPRPVQPKRKNAKMVPVLKRKKPKHAKETGTILAFFRLGCTGLGNAPSLIAPPFLGRGFQAERFPLGSPRLPGVTILLLDNILI